MKQNFNSIINRMRRMAPYASVAGFSQSRRIEGMMNTTRDKQMYASVYLYIEKGLANEEKLIQRLLKGIYYQVQGYESFDDFPLYCIAFGDEESADQLPKPFLLCQYQISILKKIIQLTGTEIPEHSTLCNLKFKRKDPFQKGEFILVRPQKDDLLVFFCRNKSKIEINDAIMKQLNVLHNNVFWIETENISKR